MDEKQEAMINVGFRFDTEEMASILLNTTLTLRGLQGPRLGLTVRLNENPYIKLDFRSSNILMGRLSLSYMYKSNNYRLYRNGRGINNITLLAKTASNSSSHPPTPSSSIPKVGVSYEHFNYNSFLFASDDDRIAVKPEGFVNYYLTGNLETLNDHYFPTRGVSVYAKAALHTDNGYGYNKGTPFASVSYSFRWALSATDRLTFIPRCTGARSSATKWPTPTTTT